MPSERIADPINDGLNDAFEGSIRSELKVFRKQLFAHSFSNNNGVVTAPQPAKELWVKTPREF
jgi:hypothetical protein